MVTISVILLTIVGELYTEYVQYFVYNFSGLLIIFIFCRRGSLISTGIFVYAATSPVNGYFGGSLYARMGGKRWIRQMLVSAFLVPAVVCGTEFFINFIAIYYHASRAIPFGSMVSFPKSCNALNKDCFSWSYFVSGCHHLYMLIYRFTFDVGGHGVGSKFIWTARLSMPRQCRPSSDPREKMVYGTCSDCCTRWNSSFRVYLH